MADTTLPTPPESRDDFEIAIICALKLERDAVETMLEVDYREQRRLFGKADGDRNAYTTGVLGGNPVVLAYPRDMNSINAATVASEMSLSFRNIKMGLVVGIAGGAPATPDGIQIWLGDVVISTAVIQYDFGRQYPDGFRRKNNLEGTLGRAPTEIANFVALLQGNRTSKRIVAKTNEYRFQPAMSDFTIPEHGKDYLLKSGFRHKHHVRGLCETCDKVNSFDIYPPVCDEAEKATCEELGCFQNVAYLARGERTESGSAQGPPSSYKVLRLAQVHFGRVASGNAVMKSGVHRDRIVTAEKVIAFEMEGAGVWDQFPTIVVKSVCDYSDSHKNKSWQMHSAAMAAACAKAILEEWEPREHSGATDARPHSNASPAPPSQQNISGTNTTGGSQSVTGIVYGNVTFGNS